MTLTFRLHGSIRAYRKALLESKMCSRDINKTVPLSLFCHSLSAMGKLEFPHLRVAELYGGWVARIDHKDADIAAAG